MTRTTTRVAQAVNKAVVFSFNVTTSDATSTNLMTTAQIDALGYSTIRDIHIRVTKDKAFLGLGQAATTTHGKDIVPVWKDVFYDFENCQYDSLTIIRSGDVNVNAEGYVVIG